MTSVTKIKDEQLARTTGLLSVHAAGTANTRMKRVEAYNTAPLELVLLGL